jgi:hypothetical protein
MEGIQKFLSGNKTIYIILALAAIIGIASANYHTGQTNTLIEQASRGTIQNDERTMITEEINNTVTNMLNGDVKASNAHDKIFNERYFARDAGESISGSSLEMNKRYVAYLDASLAVVTAYEYKSSDLQSKITAMNKAKEKLY